jgi:hypothetical protein
MTGCSTSFSIQINKWPELVCFAANDSYCQWQSKHSGTDE